jgi:outer membrane biosynthesis protein TonB
VTFSVTASGASPLAYQWQRNGADIAGASSATYRINAVAMTDNGAVFRCRVSNSLGSVFTRNATLTVTNNQPPQATITTPAEGTLYTAGQTVSFSGTATDAEDGALPASAFTWWVDFHHDDHTHPHLPPASGMMSGSFTPSTVGEPSTNVWFRIHLSVVDSAGLVHEVTRDVLPRISRVTVTTNPAGLAVSVGGAPAQAGPIVFDAVAGMTRSIGTTSPQGMGGQAWSFASWSDGGAMNHDISVPATATTYTANFTASTAPTPTPTPPAVGRIEQDDPAVRYVGTWYTHARAAHSGGTSVLAMEAGTEASLTFSGTGITWLGLRDSWSGTSDVYLDGVFQARVDSYSTGSDYQDVLFTRSGLSAGTHTLRIVVSGDRNPASGGAWVWIDAFDVTAATTPTPTPTAPPSTTPTPTATPIASASPTPTPTATPTAPPTPTPVPTSGAGRYEETDPAVKRAGSWFTNSNPRHSGGSAALSMEGGTAITFTFAGTGVRWIGLRDPYAGEADVYVDGQFAVRADLYSTAETHQALVFSKDGLPYGSHTLHILVAGTRNAASGGAWVWVDAFDVVVAGLPPTPTPESRVTPTPTFTPPPPTVTPTPTATPMPTTTPMPTATPMPSSTPSPTPVPTVRRYEQTDAAVRTTGTWFTHSNPQHSGGSAILSMEAGTEVALTFNGTAVTWRGVRDPWSGQADVFLDGQVVGRIDTYSATERLQDVLYSTSDLAAGTHTIRIAPTGTRNAASGGAWVWIDAFDVGS